MVGNGDEALGDPIPSMMLTSVIQVDELALQGVWAASSLRRRSAPISAAPRSR
jgi:hypothetical protein